LSCAGHRTSPQMQLVGHTDRHPHEETRMAAPHPAWAVSTEDEMAVYAYRQQQTPPHLHPVGTKPLALSDQMHFHRDSKSRMGVVSCEMLVDQTLRLLARNRHYPSTRR